jgi:hypothetical protein
MDGIGINGMGEPAGYCCARRTIRIKIYEGHVGVTIHCADNNRYWISFEGSAPTLQKK